MTGQLLSGAGHGYSPAPIVTESGPAPILKCPDPLHVGALGAADGLEALEGLALVFKPEE
jgi:hypothetical protein